MIKGSIEFVISDGELDFENISSRLMITPTKCVKKGKRVTLSRNAPYDIWIIKVKFNDEISFEKELEILLVKLIEKKEEIIKFKSSCNQVCINFYIRSDLGQLGFTLNPNIIQTMSYLNIEINFHILSFGYAV